MKEALVVACKCLAPARVNPWVLRPSKAGQDRPSHNPLLVLLRQKAEFVGEMRDSLQIRRLRECVGEVGTPVATPWAKSIETALEMLGHVAPRIVLQRIGRRRGELDRYIGISGKGHHVIDRV